MYKSLYLAKRNAIYHPIRDTKFKDLTEIERRTQAGKDWVENYQIYDKIADAVPPHLKTDQEPIIIADCVAKNQEFHDPQFPHTKRALIDPKGVNLHKGWDTLTWMSAREMFGNQPFFIFNGISPQDVKQQAIADCYLLGALACLATQPGLVRRLFDIEEPNKWGVYAIWLNINGEWKEYVIDDYFPVNRSGAPVFARPTQGQNEIWVMLIEKAYAKAYGGYYKIGLGRAGEAFRDLTGAPSITYEMEEARKDAQKRELIWNKVVEAFKNSFLLAASSLHTGAGYEQKQDNGIMTDHVYSILDVQEIMDSRGRAARILQMRNPWGAVEWKGDWADNSPLWTQEARDKLLSYEDDEEDGLFWMDYFDFCENFSLLFINKVEPTFTYNSVKVPFRSSKGGQFFRRIVKVGVRKAGKYSFSIDKKDIHYTNDIGEILGLSTIMVGRLEPEGKVKFIKAESNPYRNTHIRTHMEVGLYFAIIEVFYPDNVVEMFDNGARSDPKFKNWRDVAFSTYGPTTCSLHLLQRDECNSLPLDPAAYMQYRAWRDFFRNPPDKIYKYYKGKTPDPKRGKADVLLENGKVVSIEYEKTSVLGFYFYIFRNKSGRNIEFELKVNTLEGYELICRDGVVGKNTTPPGRISIPHGGLDILVMRPIDEQAKHGSVFVNGKYYNEMNRESKKEAATHDYLLTKKLFLEEADVEKFPEIKQSQPKIVKELIRGERNNVKKADPTDITMKKRYRNNTNKNKVLEQGNQKVVKYVNKSTIGAKKSKLASFNGFDFLSFINPKSGNQSSRYEQTSLQKPIPRTSVRTNRGRYSNNPEKTESRYFDKSRPVYGQKSPQINNESFIPRKNNFVRSGRDALSHRQVDLTKADRSISRPRRSYNQTEIKKDLRGVGSPNPKAGDFYARLMEAKKQQQLMKNRTVTPNKSFYERKNSNMKTIEVAGGNQEIPLESEKIGNYKAPNFGYHPQSSTNLFKTPRKEADRGWRVNGTRSEKTKVIEQKYYHDNGVMTATNKKDNQYGGSGAYDNRSPVRNAPFRFNKPTEKKEDWRQGRQEKSPQNHRGSDGQRPWFEDIGKRNNQSKREVHRGREEVRREVHRGRQEVRRDVHRGREDVRREVHRGREEMRRDGHVRERKGDRRNIGRHWDEKERGRNQRDLRRDRSAQYVRRNDGNRDLRRDRSAIIGRNEGRRDHRKRRLAAYY